MKRPVFPILVGKLAEQGILYSDLAELLDVTPTTISKKMSGKSPFTWREISSIRKTFFPDISEDILMTQQKAGGKMHG